MNSERMSYVANVSAWPAETFIILGIVPRYKAANPSSLVVFIKQSSVPLYLTFAPSYQPSATVSSMSAARVWAPRSIYRGSIEWGVNEEAVAPEPEAET